MDVAFSTLGIEWADGKADEFISDMISAIGNWCLPAALVIGVGRLCTALSHWDVEKSSLCIVM